MVLPRGLAVTCLEVIVWKVVYANATLTFFRSLSGMTFWQIRYTDILCEENLNLTREEVLLCLFFSCFSLVLSYHIVTYISSLKQFGIDMLVVLICLVVILRYPCLVYSATTLLHIDYLKMTSWARAQICRLHFNKRIIAWMKCSACGTHMIQGTISDTYTSLDICKISALCLCQPCI